MIKLRLQQFGLVVLGLAVATVMIMLGLWQMQVFEDQGTEGAVARMSEPAVELDSVASPGREITEGYGRTVTFVASYDAADQLLVPVEGDPGTYRVLTRALTPEGTLVPVVRGETDAAQAPTPPPGLLDQQGVLLASDASVPDDLPAGQIGSVYLPSLVQRWTEPMVAGYVILPAELATEQGLQPATPDLPSGRGSGQNFGYALQWWVFAAAALGFSLYLVAYIGRAAERRRLADLGLIAQDEIGPDPGRMS